MNSDLTTKMERDKQDEEDDCETVLDKIKIENLTIVEKLKFVLCFLHIVTKSHLISEIIFSVQLMTE